MGWGDACFYDASPDKGRGTGIALDRDFAAEGLEFKGELPVVGILPPG